MATTSKYYLLTSSADNLDFLDFDLRYGAVTTLNASIQYNGSARVNSLFVRPGLSYDLTNTAAGTDKIYFSGGLSDYGLSIDTGNQTLTLSRLASGLNEVVKVSGGTEFVFDKLVFANGTVASYALAAALRDHAALPAPSSTETSLAPQGAAAAGAPLVATVKAFSTNTAGPGQVGETFAATRPGVALVVSGGAGIDTVYVADGATVDASVLGGSVDQVYLRGNWADYSKTPLSSGTKLQFSRSINGIAETVTVSAGTSVNFDQLVFADGAVTTFNAKAAIATNANAPITQVSGLDRALHTPLLNDAQVAAAQANSQNTHSPAVQLTTLAAGASATGFIIKGIAFDYTGKCVSNIGDVNGDGLDDMLVSAEEAHDLTGATYVVFGRAQPATVALHDVVAGTGGFVINGQAPHVFSSQSVSSAGDMNGDGLADVIVSVSTANGGGGGSYVVYGKANGAAVNLSEIAAGHGGFSINGGALGQTDTFDFGPQVFTVGSAGDVNGDGLADLTISNYTNNSGGVGVTYLVYGKTLNTAVNLTAVAAGTGGFALFGEGTSDDGGVVSSAGDVNGDGLADLILGAKFAGGFEGRSYVVFGKQDTQSLQLGSVAAGTGGFVIRGAAREDLSGNAVSSAGDVNGDGLADLIVAAAGADKSYVVFGKTGTATVNLAAVDAGTGGFALKGTGGSAVSSAGDMNGDGLSDLVVGAHTFNEVTGRSYVVFGKADTAAVELTALLAGSGGFAITGVDINDFSGISVSSAGDVNGDGLSDLMVGSIFGNEGTGAAYILLGGTQIAHCVDFLGTAQNNILVGNAVAETFAAGLGNDTLVGNGGADVLYGGMGNDTFVLNASNVAALQSVFGQGGNSTQLARVDGGTGVDTLQLNGGASLDLRRVANVGGATPDGLSRISSIEVLDLQTDTAANTLGLRANDVVDMAGMNLFNSGNTSLVSGPDLGATVQRHQVVVLGDALDTVNMGASGWSNTGTVVGYAGHQLVVYNSTSSAAQLLVEQALVSAAHVL